MAIYPPILAYDPATGNGVPGMVATVTDPLTGIPLETLDLATGQPRQVFTNHKGHIDGFMVEGGPGVAMVRIGSFAQGVPDLMLSADIRDAALEAAQAAIDAANLVEAPADEVIALLAGNPESLTHAAVDTATGALIGEDGSAVQTRGDDRYIPKHNEKSIKSFFSRLDSKNPEPLVIAGAGDSTTDGGYEYLEGGIREFMAERYPDRPAGLRRWNKSTETLGSYFTWQNGTDTALGTLTLYNGGYSGGRASHQIERFDQMYPVRPDIFFICHGHNYYTVDSTPEAFLASIDALVDRLHATYPGVPIVAVSQNPETTAGDRTAQQVADHQARQEALRVHATSQGWGYVPAMEMFLSLPDGGYSRVMSDGVHLEQGTVEKSNPTGGRMMMDAMKAWLFSQSNRKPQGVAEFAGLSVADFGAVGDGITDDTTAIKNALAAVPFSKTGTIIFERKVYYTSHTFVLKSNTTVQGNGAVLLKQNPTDNSYAFFSVKSYGELGYGSGAKRVTIRDLEFRGTFGATPAEGRRACAFALHHAQDVQIENCRFIEMAGRGHVADLNGCDMVTFRDCVFQGFQVEGSGFAAAECIQLDQSKNGSLSSSETVTETVKPYDGLLTKNLFIDNCKFLPLTKGGVDYPCPNPLGNHTVREGQWYENIWFTNNIIVDPHEDTTSNFAGSEYNGNIHLVGTRGVHIEDNVWMSTTGGKGVRCIAIYGETKGNPVGQDPNIVQSVTTIPAQSPQDIWIRGNRFIGFDGGTLAANTLIHVSGLAAAYVENLTVDDNTFRANGTSGTVIANMLIEYASNVSVNGNDAKESRRFLTIRNCRNASVDGNKIDTVQSYPVLATDCTSISIDRNQLRNHAQGIRVDTSEMVSVDKNKFHSPSSTAAEIILAGVTLFTANGNIGKSGTTKASIITLAGVTGAGFVTGNIGKGYTDAVTNNATGGNLTVTPNLAVPA